MQINISGGKRKITLTKSERKKLLEVRDILSVLSDHNQDASYALEHVSSVIHRVMPSGEFALVHPDEAVIEAKLNATNSELAS